MSNPPPISARPRGAFELDHVFVRRPPEAAEAEILVQEGFLEGPPNVHPGQGTACRRFFFQNAYLELIWLTDRDEAGSGPIRRTGLLNRADAAAGACGVGICLRSTGGDPPPVETWPFEPPYLPPGLTIPMATSSTRLDEPLLFFLPPELNTGDRPVSVHPNGAQAVTSLQVTIPRPARPSATMDWLARTDALTVAFGTEEAVVLTLDHGRAGGRLAVPGAPSLVVAW